MLATIKLTSKQLEQLVKSLNNPLNFFDDGKPCLEVISFQGTSNIASQLTLRINEPTLVTGLILANLALQLALASTLH